MKRYPAYKDSGIEWIGEIPVDWDIRKLKHHFTFEKGENAQVYTNEYVGANSGGYPVFSGQTEDEGVMGRIASFDYDTGEVLLATTVGAKAMTTRMISGKFSLSQNCALFIPREGINVRYYQYFVDRLFDFEKGMISLIMQPSLRFEDLIRYQILMPSKEEQDKIAGYLDGKIVQIDALITKKERMIELLKEERTAVINQAVTKGLDPNVEMKDSDIEWLGKVPKHWQMKRLKYLVSLVNQPIEETTGTELRIDLENLESWTGKTIEIESQNKNIEGMKSFASGDVLFNKLRPYLAKVYRAKNSGVCGGELLVLRPTTLLDSDFLFYRVLSSAFINVVDGSTYGSKMPRASWDFIGDLIVPFPGKSEQTKIVEYLHQFLQRMDIILQKLTSEIEYLREYRAALISEVVTGKIDVRG